MFYFVIFVFMLLFISIILTIALMYYFLVKVFYPESVQEKVSESLNKSENSSLDFSEANFKDQKDNDYNDEKRLNYITTKLYKAGEHFRSVANGIVYCLVYSLIKLLLGVSLIKIFPPLEGIMSLDKIIDSFLAGQRSLDDTIESIKNMSNAFLILGVLDFIITIFLLINILWHIYEAAITLKLTKKYFQFNPNNISSRSKDPYFK